MNNYFNINKMIKSFKFLIKIFAVLGLIRAKFQVPQVFAENNIEDSIQKNLVIKINILSHLIIHRIFN